MELVLSPGFIGDNDGSPFHNEDVHEWSHVDHLTGMLENARIETGRWQAKNQGAAQSYGKVVDSRERNSADGNLVQRAQRKVEVFQSQGAGGKSFQVVRASQWSSSKVSDLIHTSSIGKSAIDHHMSELDSGINSRLNDWGLSKNLDSLSSLCRKLHSEVVNDSHSFLFGQKSAFLTDEKLSKAFEVIDRNKSLFSEKKSNSNEDLASLIEENDSSPSLNFTRDYKARRSLQLSNKRTGKESHSGVKLSDINNSERDLYVSKLSELKNPQARLRTKAHLDEDKAVRNSYSSPESSPRNSYISKNSISRSRSPNNLSFSKINATSNQCSNIKPVTYFFKDPEKNRDSSVEVQKPTSIRLCAQESRPLASNKTIVHLGKAEDESTGQIKVTIDLKNTKSESSSQESNVLFLSDCSAKPTKKVGFCKTEVHFVADSGKVNIVETDGKPPPTNRFRRRRRNSNSNNPGISANKNLPVVHFGDTSYEKYIFGAGKKCAYDELTKSSKLREEEEYKDAWQSFKSSSPPENENETKKDFIDENNLVNTPGMDLRHKGHTTTVNFGANGFCNLNNLARDDTSKLSNVEEVSLEAPKIISALDLRTRKENHNARSIDIEVAPSEEIQSLAKATIIQRPVAARVDFDHSQRLLKSVKKLSSLYAAEKSDEEEKASRVINPSEIEKPLLHVTKPEEVERTSLRLTKLNEMEKGSSRFVKANEADKKEPRLVKLSDVGKASSSMKSIETEKCCESVPVTQAKDFCDASSGAREEICDPNSHNPIYANVFESGRNDVPIYENFQAVKNDSETEAASKKVKEDGNQEMNVQNLKKDQEVGSKKIQTQLKQKSSSLRKANSDARNKSGSEPIKSSPIRQRKRETIVSKEVKNQDSDKVKNKTIKSIESEASVKIKSQKMKENKKQEDDTIKNSKSVLLKKDLKRSSSKSRNSKEEPESETTKSSKPETSNLTARVKKPVEVVYKTAIYNMKNEKLSKPAKAKESKGPRYINDIICGSKVKKSSADKRTTAIAQKKK